MAVGLLALVAALAVLLIISSRALAGETLEPPWSASGPGSVSVSSNGTSPPARMSYSIKPAGEMTPRTWRFSTKAGATGTKELTYAYSGWHGSLEHGTVFLTAFVTHEGITTHTSLASAGLGANGSFSYEGDVSFNVQAGDTYGFEFGGESDDWVFNEMNGTLKVGLQHGLPVNTALPEISGELFVNGEVSASAGSWEGATSYQYQWLQCNSGGESCFEAENGSRSTFVLQSWQAGDTLRVRVTAHNGAGEVTVESAPTAPVARIDDIEGFVISDGTESASFWVSALYAAEPGGFQLPPFSEICAQWRRSPGQAWSQSCIPIYVSVENPTGCSDTNGYEEIVCNSVLPITGLQPGTEYEARAWTTSGGSEGASRIEAFITEGEGPPRSGGTPTLSGEPIAGESLEVSGEWSGLQPISFSYTWERCVQETQTCTPIPEATGSTYEITPGDVAKTSESPYTLRGVITADNEYGELSATSEEREVLAAPAVFTTTGPEVSGEAEEGQTLTLSHYTISGLPAPDVTYEWLRCDGAGESCGPIAGAEGATYVPTSQDLNHTIRATVKASNAEYRGGAEVSETTPQSALVVAAIRACVAGSYSLSGEEPCVPASPGYYVASTGASEQTPCAAGTYNPESASASPSACSSTPPGAWSAAGSAEYAKCPAGSYQPAYGATSSAACRADPPGTYTPEFAWEVDPCQPGSYAEGVGNTGCTAAQRGHYAEGSEAAAQLPCEPGYYASGESAAHCTETPAGSYDSAPASTAPVPCPPGTYSAAAGATSCSTTPPDTYSPGGATKPTPCPAETEAPAGASTCTAKASQQVHEPTISYEKPVGRGPSDATHTVAQPGAAGETPPVISALSFAPRCISRSALGTTSRSAHRQHGRLAASFRLNVQARVTYTLVRVAAGHARSACPAASPTPQHARGKVMTTGSLAAAPGAHALPLRALTAPRSPSSLAPGMYELSLSATSANGMHSATVSIELWVLPSRSKR